MEFLAYDDVRTRFDDLMLRHSEEGDLVSLALEIPEVEVTRVVFGDAGAAEGDVRAISRDRSDIVPTVDGVLHRLHLTEVGVMPAGDWRGVLDLAAFELAQHEAWNDFEAEASMHMNGRDLLMITSAEFTVLDVIVKAMMDHADAPAHDLLMISLTTPFLMRLAHTGGLEVFCANESIADEVAQVTGSHND